ncbi:MAG: hypothetical protein QOD72_862 [Acidimicrobiaceae bacterium]|jgi:hypothetical protein|nr:hypothetical protein [Acidimicrobiaceae bacterium]
MASDVEMALGDSDFPTERDWLGTPQAFNPLPRALVLELAVRLAHTVEGDIIEFGVAEGASTRTLRRVLSECQRTQLSGRRKRIFGCDSFEGLTENYENATPGTFACDPPRIRGVEIVKGFFETSLTPELARRVGSVSLASLDADLFSSTLTALNWLTPLLHTGSLLLFDEYLGEKESERRAHEQWQAESGVRTVKVAEFFRGPSGWGSSPDRRVLFQVVDSDSIVVSGVRTIRDIVMPARRVAHRVLRAVRR